MPFGTQTYCAWSLTNDLIKERKKERICVQTHSDEHTAVFHQGPHDSQETYTRHNGTRDYQGVGRVYGPEGCDEGAKSRVHHLELSKTHDEGTTQLGRHKCKRLTLGSKRGIHDPVDLSNC